jgi:hypothetical protein
MNDYSILSSIRMFSEDRGAIIRQFGWAPGIGEMIKAKMRAQDFRVEEGKHITAFGTKEWLSTRSNAYHDRGEGAAWKETVKKTTRDHQHGPTKTKGPVWGGFSETVKSGNNAKKGEGKAGRNDNLGHVFSRCLPSMAAHTVPSPPKKKAGETPSTFKAFVESKLQKSKVWDAAPSQDTGDTRKAKSMPPHRRATNKPGGLAKVDDLMTDEETGDEDFVPAPQFSEPNKIDFEPPDSRKPSCATAADLPLPLKPGAAATGNHEVPELRPTSATLTSSVVPAKRSASPTNLGKDSNGKKTKPANMQHSTAEEQQNKAKRI